MSVGSCGKEASSCSPLSQLSPDYLRSACVLRFVAVCCSVLQCVGLFPNCLLTNWGLRVCCSVLQCKRPPSGFFRTRGLSLCVGCQRWADVLTVCCGVLQCVAVCYSVLQCVAVCCSVLQCLCSCNNEMSRLPHMREAYKSKATVAYKKRALFHKRPSHLGSV